MQGTPYHFFFQWHLTERCNLKCRHCYQQTAKRELELAQVMQGIDQLSDTVHGWAVDYDMKLSPSIHFTGGEPFLAQGLYQIIEHARSRGFTVSLMTNGTLISPTVAQHIRDAEVEDVQVSIDGLEDTHDSIRGQGSYRRAIAGARNLVAAGVDTFINLTASRLNLEDITGLAEMAGEMGLASLSISRLVPCGRGEELASQMLTPEELTALYRTIDQPRTGGQAKLNSLEPLAAIAGFEGEPPQTDFPVGGCAAGLSGITIAADGSLMPCRRMDLTIGNITRDPFRDVWATSPVLLALRNRAAYHDGCDKCDYWSVCRGCRAIALAHARAQGKEDYLGPDPQCPMGKR